MKKLDLGLEVVTIAIIQIIINESSYNKFKINYNTVSYYNRDQVLSATVLLG